MSFFENTRRPDGIGGKIMVSVMNVMGIPIKMISGRKRSRA